MSVATADLRKVRAVVPQDIIQAGLYENYLDKQRFFEQLNQHLNNETEEKEQEASKPTKFKLVSKIKAFVQTRKEKRENKIFDKIRNDMIANAFGVSPKELEKYKFDYANKQEIANPETVGEVLRDSRDVYQGQAGANARSTRDIKRSALMTGVTVGGLAIPFLSTKFAFLGTFAAGVSALISAPLVAGGLAIGGLILGVKKYKKAKVGNTADAAEKYRSYMEKLDNFMQESNNFLSLVDKDNSLILEQKKKLSKKEFKKWCDEYSKQKYEEFQKMQLNQKGEAEV